MSYILDALRRLEQDKERTKKGANPVEAVLLPDVGKPERPERSHRWWVGLGVVLLATVVGATYWVTRRTLVVPAGLARENTVPHLPPAPSGYDGSVPAPSAEVASSSVQPLRSDREPPIPAPTRTTSLRSSLPPASTSPLGKAVEADSSLPVEAEEVSQPVVSASGGAPPGRQKRMNSSREVSEDDLIEAWTGSELKINAIAYSLDDKSRFAVVNLKTVHEGDELEGLAVVAIQEDGIVFKKDGRKYKVSLGKR